MKLILEDVPSPVSGDGMGRQYTGVEMAWTANARECTDIKWRE